MWWGRKEKEKEWFKTSIFKLSKLCEMLLSDS